MRERSILFATPLVLALIAGRKTQTRRLIFPQPDSANKEAGRWQVSQAGREQVCPFGVAGDRLWVREKWGYERQFFDRRAKAQAPYVYAADGNPTDARFTPWKPSLHMPRAASRLLLEVTSVAAEQLSAISAANAAAEGCPLLNMDTPVKWFSDIWDGYYASRGLGWKADPWVWVVRFQVITPAIEVEAIQHQKNRAVPTPVKLSTSPVLSQRVMTNDKDHSSKSNGSVSQVEPSPSIVALRNELLSRLRDRVGADRA